MNENPRRDANAGSRETILLVGASSDIGLEIIRQLAADKPLILAHCNRSIEKLETLRQSLQGVEIVPIRADLSRAEEVDRLVATLRDQQPAPDKIVHLAAPKLEYLRFKDVSWADFQRGWDVQVRSLVSILQAFLPGMAQRKRGKVVVALSSVTLGIPPAALSHYVTVKYALLGLVRALAAEYSSKHVNVNAVSPSMVETAFLEKLPSRMVEMAAAQAPWDRNAVPRDVAGAVRFLLSDDADYVTGANFPISGGTAF
jgi:3-oxoacyl-[acyl-carrier protein] reductase